MSYLLRLATNYERRGDHLDLRKPLSVARFSLRAGRSRPHIGAMQHLDLTDDEAAALIQELHDIVENDRYPYSPRIRTLRAILNKVRPGAGARALAAAAEGVSAAASNRSRKTLPLKSGFTPL